MNIAKIFAAALASAFVAVGGLGVYMALTMPPETQILALAKGEYLGKTNRRTCSLTRAENAKVLLDDYEGVSIRPIEGESALQYASMLRHGFKHTARARQHDMRVPSFAPDTMPVPDSIYVVDMGGTKPVLPIFIVGGCIVPTTLEVPRAVHWAIIKEMKGRSA